MSRGIQEDAQAEARAAFRRTFLDLYAEHPAKEIAVAQLCAIANYSRSTFYSYYCGVSDLLDECIRLALPHEAANYIVAHIDTVSPEVAGRCVAVFLDERASLLHTLLRQNDNDYLRQLYDVVKPMIDGFVRRAYNLSPEAAEVMSSMMTRSKVSLVEDWVHDTSTMTLVERLLLSVDAIENQFWVHAERSDGLRKSVGCQNS